MGRVKLRHLVGPSTWAAYWRELRQGVLPRRPAADTFQQGGDVLIDPRRHRAVRARRHRPGRPSDRPSASCASAARRPERARARATSLRRSTARARVGKAGPEARPQVPGPGPSGRAPVQLGFEQRAPVRIEGVDHRDAGRAAVDRDALRWPTRTATPAGCAPPRRRVSGAGPPAPTSGRRRSSRRRRRHPAATRDDAERRVDRRRVVRGRQVRDGELLRLAYVEQHDRSPAGVERLRQAGGRHLRHVRVAVAMRRSTSVQDGAREGGRTPRRRRARSQALPHRRRTGCALRRPAATLTGALGDGAGAALLPRAIGGADSYARRCWRWRLTAIAASTRLGSTKP